MTMIIGTRGNEQGLSTSTPKFEYSSLYNIGSHRLPDIFRGADIDISQLNVQRGSDKIVEIHYRQHRVMYLHRDGRIEIFNGDATNQTCRFLDWLLKKFDMTVYRNSHGAWTVRKGDRRATFRNWMEVGRDFAKNMTNEVMI